MMRKLLAGLMCGCLFVAGCSRDPDTVVAASTAPPPLVKPAELQGQKVLATVNGAIISEDDVRLALRIQNPEEAIDPAVAKPVVEALIRQEVLAQAAEGQGLEPGTTYRRQLRQLEAQKQAARRSAFGDAWFAAQMQKSAVTEADARAWFQANQAAVQAELHCKQIFVRERAAAERALREIRGGAHFDEVARKDFPGLPVTEIPWDLGFLKWQQIPQQWRGVVDKLPAGETSGVIEGANHRFWVVQVVERRQNPQTDFAAVQDAIVTDLQNQRAESLRNTPPADLLQAARITRSL